MDNTLKTKLFLLIIALFFITAGAYSQLSIDVQSSSVKDAIKEIETKSNYRFFYSNDLPDLDKKVTLKVTGQPIEKVLNLLFQETKITYIINGRQIALAEKSRSVSTTQDDTQLRLSSTSKQPERIVTGRVLDSNNEPLIGANIREVGTSNGAVTDVDGNYRILISNPNGQLSYSYVGFSDKVVSINDRNSINVTMEDSESVLDEIVVIGYGTQRKVDVTGAISTVNMKDLQTSVATNAGQALQGQVAGVNVRNFGLPGDNSTISIRGITSFGDISPLIIVDGVASNLNNISPQDIESMQVLKDARVAAIYGVRGANGVVLITTKKGKAGAPPRVTYNGQGGVTYPLPGNVFNLMNSEEYMNMLNFVQPFNELFANGMPDYSYNSPYGSGVAFEGDPQVDPSNYFREEPNVGNNYLIQPINKIGTDWFHEAFKKAYFHEHNLSVAGGSQHSKYFFSLGYLDQQGTLTETYLKRYSIRVNTEVNIGKNIKIGENLSFFYKSYLPVGTGSQYGSIPSLYTLLPIIPLKDIMGEWGGTWAGPQLGAGGNPIGGLHRKAANSDYDSYSIVGNVFAEINFFKDFTFRTSYGLNNYNIMQQSYTGTSVESAEANAKNSSLTVASSVGRTTTFSNTLNFQKDLGNHNLDFLIGTELIQALHRNLDGSAEEFFSNNKNYLLLQRAEIRYPASNTITKTALLSLFGRFDYNYDDRYLFGVTIRRDGSSYFGPLKRFGTFPSFSVGWRMSQERFMQNVKWLNDLKIRASYGVLGSQNNVPIQNQFSTYASSIYHSAYDISGTSNSVEVGISRNRIGNSATGWEEDIVQNIGLDIVAFNNSLEFQADVYKKTIRGLLIREQLPSVVGALVASPTVNIGDIQNTGVDLSSKYRFNLGRIRNSVSLNFTHYKNKIVHLPDPGFFGGSSRNEIGYPTGMFYGYNIIGIFNSQEEVDNAPIQDDAEPGRFRYEDTDDDGVITPDDRQFLGSPHPDFTYGFILNSEYKGFDISAQFYGVQGNTIHNAVRMNTEFFSIAANKSRKLLNAWTPENTNTTVHKVDNAGGFSTKSAFNSYALEDGSYFRLKTLTLGYTFNRNKAIMKRLGISNFRIYTQASNIFTITNYSGVDPDIAAGSPDSFGIDWATYPTNERRVIFGLTFTY